MQLISHVPGLSLCRMQLFGQRNWAFALFFCPISRRISDELLRVEKWSWREKIHYVSLTCVSASERSIKAKFNEEHLCGSMEVLGVDFMNIWTYKFLKIYFLKIF